jgi:hypothetical protein
MHKHLTLISLCLLLAGCSTMLPSKRTENASVKTADSIATQQTLTVEKIIESTEVPVSISGSSNAVVRILPAGPGLSEDSPPAYKSTLRVTSGAVQSGGSSENATSRFSISLPTGVKLILLAIGILLLVVAGVIAKRAIANTAAGQAIGLADAFLANRIRALRERVMHSTDAEELARVNAEIAGLESDRGRLLASR